MLKKMEEEKKMGRPSIYSNELATEICRRISLGESLRKICQEDGMPVLSTIMLWLLDDTKKDFSDHYAQACNSRAELMFEEINELSDASVDDIVGDDKSDGARVQARKLQIDARKWYLSKVLPKKFGDKLDITSDNKPIPLLHAIRNNDGNTTNSGPEETH